MDTNLYYAEWSTVLTGLALGCLTTDLSGFPTNRPHFERAIGKAWPEWPQHGAYRQFLPRDYSFYAIRSTLMHPSPYVTWEWEHGVRPVLAAASADDALAQFAADQPVTVDEWKDLARRVTAELPASS